MPLKPGQTLARYEILAHLGSGAAGEVYRARDPQLDREVAIKVLPDHLATDRSRLQRFEREAKALASLSHPNLAHIYEIGRTGERSFIAMELVPGEDLATRIRRGPLSVDEAIGLARQIAEGLEAAHEAGVVHRDLKPENIRVTPEGVVKILDFGLAKLRREAKDEPDLPSDAPLVTEEGILLGTPIYMSPEHIGGGSVDRRTDIWAFGCVLYECLTGKRAFQARSFAEMIAAIQERDVDFEALPAGTPEHVRELLARTLVKDPRMRLRDIGEARIILVGGAAALESADVVPRTTKSASARWSWFASGALCAAVGVVVLLWLAQRVAPNDSVEVLIPVEVKFQPSQETLREIEQAIRGGSLPKIGGFTLADREPTEFSEVRIYHDTDALHLRNALAALSHTFSLPGGEGEEPIASRWSYYHIRDPESLRRLVLRETEARTLDDDRLPGTAILDRIQHQAYDQRILEQLTADLGRGLDLLPRVVVVTTNKQWQYRMGETDRRLNLEITSVGATWWTSGTSIYLDSSASGMRDIPRGEFVIAWKELELEALDGRGVPSESPDLQDFESRYELEQVRVHKSKYHFAVDRLIGKTP